MAAIQNEGRLAMRKITIALCILILFAGIAAGCSQDGMPKLNKEAPTTVVVWNYYSGKQMEAFDALVEEFNNTEGAERGVIVESVSKLGSDVLSEDIIAAASGDAGAGPLPNAAFLYSDVAYLLAQRGLLADYNRYLSEAQLDAYVDDFLQEGKVLGTDKIYILPVAKATEVIVINRTDLGQFIDAWKPGEEPDSVIARQFASWEGILGAAQAYYEWSDAQSPDTPGDGKAFFGIDVLANFIFTTQQQLGGGLVTVENGVGTVNLNAAALQTAWDTYYVPIVKGYFGEYNKFRSDDLKAGDILSYLGSSSSAVYIPTEVTGADQQSHPIDVDILPMPVYEGMEPVAIQQGAGMALLASAPEKEYATTVFATWFTDPERNTQFVVQSSYMPVTREALNSLAEKVEGAQDVVERTQDVTISQMLAYQMYTVQPYTNAFGVRQILEGNMRTIAKNSRKGVEMMMASGIPYETAVATFTGPEYLMGYLDDCHRDLDRLGVGHRE